MVGRVFGYLFLCAFVLMIPNMDEARQTGLERLLLGHGPAGSVTIKETLYVVIFISQWLCGLATVTSVSRMLFAFSRDDGIPGISKALSKVDAKYRSPVNAIWAGSTLAVLFVWFTSAITDCRRAGLLDRRVVHGHLPVPVVHGADRARRSSPMARPSSRRRDPGPSAGRCSRLVCVLSIIAMGVIIFAGIQPPNDWALPITVGFIVLSLVLWLLFENRRFKGPPIGDEIKRRQAEIKAAEAALGRAG